MSNNARDELANVLFAIMDERIQTKEYALKVADAVLAAGYRKPRAITTVAEIRELHALDVVIHDDMENGGPLQTYVVPDDGTVMFRHREEFHMMTFGGDYIDAKDMPLPLTLIYSVGAGQ